MNDLAARPLRILLTMCYLVHRTGAELFTRDLALWLRRRGHAVTIFATAFGDMANELRNASIGCITDVADMAARPDVIIGNTHHETVRALLHFHDVPVLTICHDRSADHGRPPPFTQVVCHVAVDENCAERLVHEFGIARERIELIQNGVDLSRFGQRTALPAQPRTALVFSNYASHDAQVEEVRAACAQRGLALDVIGSGSGNHLDDPAAALGHYDVVFAKGRCATEALVTGNALVVLDPSLGMGEMVTAATASHARRWNFGRALMTRPITRENVGAELDRYDAEDAREAGAWMRSQGGLDVTLTALESCARRMVQDHAVIELPADQRADEVARYMDDWIRRGSPMSAHLGIASLREHYTALQQSFNDHQHAHQARLEALLAEVQRNAELAALHARQLQAVEGQRHADLATNAQQLQAAETQRHADRAASQAQQSQAAELAALQARQLQAAEAAYAASEQQLVGTRAELARLQAQLREVYASRSWRVTAPLRRITTLALSRVRRA